MVDHHFRQPTSCDASSAYALPTSHQDSVFPVAILHHHSNTNNERRRAPQAGSSIQFSLIGLLQEGLLSSWRQELPVVREHQPSEPLNLSSILEDALQISEEDLLPTERSTSRTTPAAQ